MEEFSLREVCNSIIMDLNKNIGDKNIVRLWSENTIPDWYQGNPTSVINPIKVVSAFMALNLINGIISLELKEWSKNGDQIFLYINITGSGTAEPEVSPHHKSEEQLNREFQDIGLRSSYDISFYTKNKKMNAKLKVALTLSEKINSTSSNFLNKRVLIVEDNEVNALVFSSFLEDWGVNVELAYNGEDGVEMVWTNDYDAVIMDIYMPGLNGFEATKKIREFNNKVPIIALSASTLPTDMKNAFEVGINEYLSKPVASDKLFNALSKFL